MRVRAKAKQARRERKARVSEATENVSEKHEALRSKATENVSAKHGTRGSEATKNVSAKPEGAKRPSRSTGLAFLCISMRFRAFPLD